MGSGFFAAVSPVRASRLEGSTPAPAPTARLVIVTAITLRSPTNRTHALTSTAVVRIVRRHSAASVTGFGEDDEGLGCLGDMGLT